MDNLNFLNASYLNYQLTHKKTMIKKNTSLEVVLNLAIVFLVVIFCAQLLSAWQLKADAQDLLNYGSGSNLVELFVVPTAVAAEPISLAEVTPYTTNLVMKAKQEATLNLVFINRGQTTWLANQVTLETGPFLKSSSKVQQASWLSFFKVMVLPKNVKPGEKITLSFKIAGPDAQYVGVLQENFQLVNNQQPIKGSLARVFVDANQVTPNFSISSDNSQITASPVKVVTTPKAVKNNVQYITAYDKLGQLIQVVKGQYVPGISLIKPSVAAIAVEKNRLASLNPVASSSQIFCIALSAAEQAVLPQCQTSNDESQAGSGIVNYVQKLIQEPLIRVGLFSSDQTQRVTSEQSFDIYAANNLLVGAVPAQTVAVVSYAQNNNQYTVIVGNKTYRTNDYLRFVSRSGNDGIFQLPDYRHNPGWNANLNDNKFRRVLEYRYTAKTDQLWWINELPIDSYLKGLAETSNASPIEFQKVLATAARTYALYHYYRGLDFGLSGASTKHAAEYFHVDATYDQVYRGYNSEIRMPRLAQAIDNTKGVIVTYNNKLAVTPYFSRSDGRTRSWDEVWGGGDKPWLQSVSVPEDSGKTLFGHGVGMSAQGALLMIVDGGQNWQNVLTYFYQGTVLQQAY